MPRGTGSLLMFVLALTAGAARADTLLGVAGPASGPNAWLGELTQHGFDLAVDDLNVAGGVLGQQVRSVAADDFCDPDQGQAAAAKLVADRVAAVIGHQCSGAAIAASPAYGEAGVVLVSNAATNPRLTELGIPTVFRVVGRDDQQGAIAAAYLATVWRDRPIAIVHDGQAYGKGLAEEVRKGLAQHGVRESLFTAIQPGQPDYGPLVDQLRERGIAVLHYSGYAPEAGLIARQAKAAGLALQLVCGDGTSSEDFRLVAGEAAEGTLLTNLADPSNRSEAASVVARMRAMGEKVLPSGLYAYAAVQAWAQAARAAGSTDGKAVAAALRAGSFDTIVGRLGFDAKGDVTGVDTFRWYRWHAGDLVPAAEIAAIR
jgi:branched-chain amino acid transport system substrate-binding protein